MESHVELALIHAHILGGTKYLCAKYYQKPYYDWWFHFSSHVGMATQTRDSESHC